MYYNQTYLPQLFINGIASICITAANTLQRLHMLRELILIVRLY